MEETFEIQGTWAYGAIRLCKKRALRAGVQVRFRREADNPHDPNAIEVMRNRSKLGYVPRDLAADIADSLDEGRYYKATIVSSRMSRWGDKRPTILVNLEIDCERSYYHQSREAREQSVATSLEQSRSPQLNKPQPLKSHQKPKAPSDRGELVVYEMQCPHCLIVLRVIDLPPINQKQCPSCLKKFRFSR